MMTVKEKVYKVIGELSQEECFDNKSSLRDDLGIDSLGMVTMLIELEDTLGIYFDPYDMDPTELITVNDVITMVKRYINEDSEETC